jgi:hypothetical protein
MWRHVDEARVSIQHFSFMFPRVVYRSRLTLDLPLGARKIKKPPRLQCDGFGFFILLEAASTIGDIDQHWEGRSGESD